MTDEVRFVQAGSLATLETKVNSKIEDMEEDGFKLESCELEIKPTDEHEATYYCAVLHFTKLTVKPST